MKLLAIETSCDETAVAILEADGFFDSMRFTVLGNALYSQAQLHSEYGGVFPTLAKREHQKNLVPLLRNALAQAGMKNDAPQSIAVSERIQKILEREPELKEQFNTVLPSLVKPDIDAIAITHGPGLEPALWVGVNFAQALSALWNIPLIPVNHMEGHLASALLRSESEHTYAIDTVALPLCALLISGGHTELVLMRHWGAYELIGATRDDAVGEAFDKVARMLDLPYPGGPHVSRHAQNHRRSNNAASVSFPRPMLGDATCDFSFSGLKTAVLYHLKKFPDVNESLREETARAFEDAAGDVLAEKTRRAIEKTDARTLAIGGGVSANDHIRRTIESVVRNAGYEGAIHAPEKDLTGDNAIMIGVAGYFRLLSGAHGADSISADANLRLAARS